MNNVGMSDMAYIVSRTLENKIAIAENNDQNTMLVTLDVLKEILALLKELEAMNVDAFVQWCFDSHIMGDAIARGIKYWVEEYKKLRKVGETK